MLRLPILSVFLLLVLSIPAIPCVAEFGYTDTPRAEIDSVLANVPVKTAYIVLQTETDNLVNDVNYIVSKAGPVFVNIELLIFNPSPSTVTTCPYERGQAGETVTHTNLRGNYQARIDTFFATNAALFQGSRKVYGLILSSEANNRCIEPWRLNAAATYVKSKLAAVAQYGPVYTIVGYGLRTGSKGFPVNPNDLTIATFPYQVDVIAYWVYDIFDPTNPAHPLNINTEGWTSINGKLNQALRPSQRTFGVVKAFCNQGDSVEAAWGVGCPTTPTSASQAVWKIGTAAENWARYWRADPRNLFMIGFNWPSNFVSSPAFVGSKNLSAVWAFHKSIQEQVNCSVP